MNMKKWFVGLMVLLTLVLASSTAMAVADYRVCSNCWEYRNGTTEYITDPNEIETSWDMHTDRIFTCSVCSVKTKLWSLHTGGGATCTTEGTCDFCHAAYKDSSVHTGPYTYSYSKTSDTRHNVKATCKGCWQKAGTYSAKHEEAEAATCKTVAYCGLCRSRYGEKDPGNHVGTPTTTHVKTSETQHTAKITYADCGHTVDGASTYHTETTPATCTAAAYCADCKSSYGEADPDAHALESHDAQAPTCFHVGWDAYETCSRCDHTTYAEQPALKHDLEQHAAKAPTCTEKGWNAYDTCSRCDYTTYAEQPALNHDYQAVTVDPTCEADGYTIFTCSRCKDSYTADPTGKLGHQFGAWSPNGTGSQSADCLRDGCAHTGSTDCRKFTFRTAEGETLTFCPVCGQAENAAQLEKLEAATAWALSGSLSAEDVTARTNGEYLSVAFETAGSLTQPTGRVRLALPAGLLEGKKLVRIAPDGTQTEMPFETERGKLIYTLDFANSELPVMLFRLVPQPTAL